jgi:CheY-like chemotaxis protein
VKSLIVEADFVGRAHLQRILGARGDCHVAVSGPEAVDAFALACSEGSRYDLVCLGIAAQGMDAVEVLRRIRAVEEAEGILPGHGAKVVETTPPGGKESPREASGPFDACVARPVSEPGLLELLERLGLTGTEQGHTPDRALRRIITICSYCKGIRNGDGTWTRLEAYLLRASQVLCSHGICPACLERIDRDPDAA